MRKFCNQWSICTMYQLLIIRIIAIFQILPSHFFVIIFIKLIILVFLNYYFIMKKHPISVQPNRASGSSTSQTIYDVVSGEDISKTYQNYFVNMDSINSPHNKGISNQLMSNDQIYMFRSQIFAYKHLIRGEKIPEFLNDKGINSHMYEQEKDRLASKAIKYYRQKVQKQEVLKKMIVGSYHPKNDQKNIEQQKNLEEMVVKNRIQKINRILNNEELTEQTRERLEVELKFLKVRDIYKSVFDKILVRRGEEIKSTRLFQTQLLDRNFFRLKKIDNENVKKLGKDSNLCKALLASRQKFNIKEFMKEFTKHRQQFQAYHNKKNKTLRRIFNQNKINSVQRNNEMKQTTKAFELDRQKLKEAIKRGDMEQTIKLAEKLKNDKIKKLLQQTNQYLKEIGLKIISQRQNKTAQTVQMTQQVQNGEIKQHPLINANNIYYQLSHKLYNQLQKQPSLLKGGQIKKYQLIGLSWLASLYNNGLNGILADEMGLGKTIQTIALLCYLMQEKKNYGPFLIIVPLATIYNWTYQLQKWGPSIKFVIYLGNKLQRKQVSKKMKDSRWSICLTTYEYILKDRNILSKYQWEYIIVDEGHKLKNHKSKFVSVLGQQYYSNFRLLLTGTPLQNNLSELWSLLNFLLPKIFNSCEDFHQWFSVPIGKKEDEGYIQLNQQQRMLIINRLHQVLRPFLLRRVKSEVLAELPEKRQENIYLKLSGWQQYIYKFIAQVKLKELNSNIENFSAKSLNNIIIQLRKCCNHPFLFIDNYYDLCDNDQFLIRSSGKFQLLNRILPKLLHLNHKVLIFTQMTKVLNLLQIFLQRQNINYLRLDGSTKSEDRMMKIKQFNKQQSIFKVFILSTRAGGLGLNLQAADTVIIFDSDWNPQVDLQAQDRAHRLGQKNKVIVLRLVTQNSIQEQILEKAQFKLNLNEIFIQGGMYDLNSNQEDRKKKLQTILKNTQKQQSKILSNSQLNQVIARNQEQFSIYQQISKNKNEFQINLMSKEQIPQEYLFTNKQQAETKQYGRGKRKLSSFAINYKQQEQQAYLDILEEPAIQEFYTNKNNVNAIKNQYSDEEQFYESQQN